MFSNDSRLTVAADPKIELFKMTVTTAGIKPAKAIDLLKAQETQAFGPNGCGIKWQAPAEQNQTGDKGSREAVYRGDRCNCQARIKYLGDLVVALTLSSAC